MQIVYINRDFADASAIIIIMDLGLVEVAVKFTPSWYMLCTNFFLMATIEFMSK